MLYTIGEYFVYLVMAVFIIDIIASIVQIIKWEIED